jgi:hypothetical protein
MSGAAQVMTEDDGGGGSVLDAGYSQGGAAQPSPFANLPPSAPAQRQQGQQQQPELVAVDADEDLRPLERPAGTQTEAPLSEAEGGPSTYVEQQQAERESRPAHWKSPGERHAARRQGRDTMRAENTMLRAQLTEVQQFLANNVTPRLAQIDRSRLEGTVSELSRQISDVESRRINATRQLSEAIVTQDGNQVQAALEARDRAIAEGIGLATRRAEVERFLQQQPTQPPQQAQQQDGQWAPPPAPESWDNGQAGRQPQRQGPRLTAVGQALVNDFVSAYPWLRSDPIDAVIAKAIDDGVIRDGYNPDTNEYYDELDDRLRQTPQLGHRFAESARQQRPANGQGNGQQQQRQQPAERRGPMVAGGSDRGPARAAPNAVYISSDRKAAMIQTGALNVDGTVNDKNKFQRQLKSYQDFDRANGSARQ